MVTIFQCVCGVNIQISFGMDEVICPLCGTRWSQNMVRLVCGTVYDIKDNGLWVARQTSEPAISGWRPTNIIFGE